MLNKTTLAAFATALTLLLGVSCAQGTSYCQQGGAANVLAPWYCSQINQAVAGVWQSWAPVAIGTIMLAFLIAAAIFMLGTAMKNDKVRNFGVGEMYEASATALIAIFFLTLCAILFGLIPAFTTGPVNPYDTSLSYLNSMIGASRAATTSVYNVIMVDSYYASWTLGVSAPGFSWGGEIEALNSLASGVLTLFVLPGEQVCKLMVDGMLALSVQFYIIVFFMYLAIPVFLIPGIIFRAIFPLRGLGGMLIAVAIAFYVVLPLLVSVAYYFTSTSVIGQLDAASQALTVHGQGTLAQTNAASPSSPLVTDVKGLESSMGAFFLAVMVYPALILAITYVAMREIAEFIGGVSKMSGKLKMI
jgi:hypothetical protein